MEEKSLAVVEDSELIKLTQLPVIEERLREVKEEWESICSNAESLVCTEENYKELKRMRSDMTKKYKIVDAQYRDAKAAYMAPWKKIEEVYASCVKMPYETADATFKRKIDDVTDGLKEEKKATLRKYFDEYCLSVGVDQEFVNLSGIKVDMSTTLKALKEDVRQRADRAVEDLKMIDTLEFRDEVLVEYRKSLNATDAVMVVNERHRLADEERKRREETAAAKAVEEAHEAAINAILTETAQNASESVSDGNDDTLAPPSVKVATEQSDSDSEQILKTKYLGYEVFGTLGQLKRLKAALRESLINFCDMEGMNYGEC